MSSGEQELPEELDRGEALAKALVVHVREMGAADCSIPVVVEDDAYTVTVAFKPVSLSTMSEPTEQTKTIEQRLREIVAGHLNVDESQVTREAKLDQDLGADSLDSVELVIEVEDAFRDDPLSIPDSEAEKIQDQVGEHLALLMNRAWPTDIVADSVKPLLDYQRLVQESPLTPEELHWHNEENRRSTDPRQF